MSSCVGGKAAPANVLRHPSHTLQDLDLSHEHQIETGFPSHDPADSLSRAFLVVTATTDEIVRAGENEKEKEKEKMENEKEKDNGKVVLSWWIQITFHFHSFEGKKNPLHIKEKKGEMKASQERVDGEMRRELRREADKCRKVKCFSFSSWKKKKPADAWEDVEARLEIPGVKTAARQCSTSR